MIDFYLLSGAIAFTALGYVFYTAHQNIEREYRDNMQAFSVDHRHEFHPVDHGDVLQLFSYFPIFSEYHGHKVTNILYGNAPAYKSIIFEHSYIDGLHFIHQTAVILQLERVEIPAFTLRRYEWAVFSKHHGITFPSHPDFSKSYCLEGDDVQSIRRVFHEDLIQLFEANSFLCAEACENKILLYRDRTRVEARGMPHFIDLVDKVFIHLSHAR